MVRNHAEQGRTAKPTAAGEPPSALEADASARGSVKPPGIDLSRYKADGEGPVLRFLRERTVLERGATVVATAVARFIALDEIESVQTSFESALDGAHREFVTQFPDTRALLHDAGLDQLRQNYEAALAKLETPKMNGFLARSGPQH